MNINLSNLIKNLIPFFLIISIIYILNSILYLWLPKEGIENIEKANISLPYKRYNIKKNYQDKIIPTQTLEVKKQEYKLLANVVLQAIYSMSEEKGWIVVAESSTTHMLAVGESFKGYKLIRVYVNYVIFSKANVEYKLELKSDKKLNYSITKKAKTNKPQDDENIIVLDDKVSVKRAYLNSYINNFDKIWKDIRIKESRDSNGKINGFKVTDMNTKGVFGKLGLQKSDIIKAINNVELKSYNDAFNIYKKINNIENLQIKVLRNGKEMELDYEIK